MNEDERNLELHVECYLCHKIVVIKVREEDYNRYLSPNRPHIQDNFPYLTSDEREMLLFHTCHECWDKMFEEFEDVDPHDGDFLDE